MKPKLSIHIGHFATLNAISTINMPEPSGFDRLLGVAEPRFDARAVSRSFDTVADRLREELERALLDEAPRAVDQRVVRDTLEFVVEYPSARVTYIRALVAEKLAGLGVIYTVTENY